ncbi:hypothetical protein [Halalkalicoccus ordinarius]|uniref:hypothetical protein n=1 Tax=Halalkalicoccus ordinarius TaxID=3116651 RepID=UPI00300E8E14
MAIIHGQTPAQTIERSPRQIVYPAKEAAVMVGSTPVARYASWADHRSAIRRSADDARSAALARRVPRQVVVPTRQAAALVGGTPAVRYTSWTDHRSAIRSSADDARVAALARRAS